MSMNDFLDYDSVSETVKKLKIADNEYYNNSNPSLTDSQYDKMKDSLRNVEPDHEYFGTVGSPVREDGAWKKYKHDIPMSSLDKCNTSDEFTKWSKGINNFIVEDKLDGISIDLQYVNGNLKHATTRGDGSEGQDILINVLNMQNVKKSMKTHNTFFTGNIRGEIVITKSDFTRLLKLDPDKKNRRNTASGLATRQDGQYVDYLTIFYYDIIEKDNHFETEGDKLIRIESLGLKTSNYTMAKTFEDVVAVMEEHITSLREKKDFDIDGLVVKINNISEQEELGCASNGNPRGQIAWKFPNETAVTSIKDIEWSIGLNGAITPVAIMEPVYVAGAMISRASLGSYGEFKRLKLHKDDVVEISRRNDVIPKLERVISSPRILVAFVAPSKCPSCGKALATSDKRISCENASCGARGLGDVMTWVKALDIKGMGPSIVESLFTAEFVRTAVDFYTPSFINNGVMSPKVTQKMVDQFNDKKELPLDIFIDGLNIDGVGGSTTRMLIKAGHDTLDKILALKKSEVASVDGLGDIKADMVVKGLKDKSNLIKSLLKHIKIVEPKKAIEGASLSGKKILFTGTMVTGGRKEMSAEAIENGATVLERVSSDLNILIVPNLAWTSSKTQKAKKLGIQIITEEEYRKMLLNV